MSRYSSKARSSKDKEGLALYEEITSLRDELSANDKIKKRRKALERLCGLLRDATVRNRISSLAVQQARERGHSPAKARSEAMSAFWSLVLDSAFNSTNRLVAGGKNKLTQQDIAQPLSLVPLADEALSGSRVRLESYARLSEKNVKRILKFCFDILDHDEARTLAELEAMNALLFLCERVDYVAYFRPDNEIMSMLATVEASLQGADEVSVAAAKIFSALVQSCYELGIALHGIIDQCLIMVSKWCKRHITAETYGTREFGDLVRGITTLLRFHPEQSIKPLTRYGRILLSYAKRVHVNADSMNRSAIHGYYIAHLNVNQEAGKLRGLLPGDLGSLGRASLNSKQLDTLLPSVLLSLTKLDLSFTAKKRTTWKALDSNVRRHLEVCARLIACAQRQYLIERDWALLEDPNEYLTGKVKEFAWAQRKDDLMCARTSAKDRPNESSLSLLQQSPWVQHIIRPLLETVPMSDGSTSSDYPMADVNDATNTQSTQVPPNIDPGTAGNLPSHHHPLLDLFPPPHGPDILNSKKLVPLLYVIAACAEAFPSGSCWTSSAQKYWYTILPEDKLVEDVVHVKTCSSEDLALLIHILSNLLEACGNSTGDPEIQALTLLCLIRLTEAHSVFSSLLEGKRQSIIAASWRRVWNVLFRTDLRYFAYTVNASEGSCGEFVMVLLTEMVHRCCTDPEIMFSGGESPRQSTFLNKAQMQLWTLPAFSKGTHLRVGYTLELLCVFLHRMTLSDEGRDNIFDTLPFPSEEGLLDNEGRRYFGRRFRLTCLCLHFMESLSLDTLTSRQEMVGLVSASLSALVHGRSFFDIRNRTFARGSSNRSWVRSPSPGDALSCKFCLTEMPDVDVFFDEQDAAGCLCLFSRLWENPMPDPGKSSLLRCRLAESIRSDIVATERLALLKMVHRLDSSSRHTDYVPPTNPLRGIVRGQIKEVKNTHWIPSANEEESDPVDAANVNVNAIVDELASLPLSLHTLWVKVALSFCLSGKEEVLVDEIDRLSDELETLFKRINGGISHLCDNQVECWDVFSDLFQIFLYLRDLFSADPSAAVQSIVVKSAIPFVETCESLLLAFAGADREEDKNASWDDPGVLIESTDDNSESEDSDENDDERNAVDLLEDSDDDDVVNKKRAAKRQRKEKKRKQKRKRAIATIRTNQRDEIYRRKKRRNNPKPPNQKCACIIGSILITLDPSLKRCDTVINCLLGDGEDDKQVDLSLTYHCVILLVDKSILFHDNALRQFVPDADQNDESFRNLSPVTLFCEVLDLIRESADRTSFLHMFGFDLLAECVRLGEDKNRGAPLSIDESKSLVELLTTFKHDSNAVENDSIELRPHLRSHRLRQATIAFESGGDIFHTCIDGFFPKTFVIPSIKDLSASVRRDACLAVAAALHILRENIDRIMNTLERILPPISSPDDKEAAYHAWYERNNLEKVDHEGRVWEDARNSVESSAIYCRAIIAGVSNDSTEKMLYDFVCFSWIRPELEAYCFQACDKIAMMLGYKKAEDLITDQSECLIRRWLEDGKNFADIPLILSSPRLLRLMLETGQQPLLYENKKLSEKANESGMEALDVTNLKDVASDAFIDNYKTYILPQMLARFVSSHSAELSEDGGIKDLILQDQSLKEFCVCLKGDHESDTMMTIISSRLHDIDAYCAPLMHTELEKVSKDILRVVNVFLFGCDDEEKRKESRKPHLTIRQILELSGRDNFKVSNVSIIKEAFLEAISVFIDKKVGSKTSALLSSAGTSITECFLHSRQWLERATLSSQKEKRWSTLTLLFDLVFTEIRDQRYRQTQLAFGVNCLIDVVINPRLTCVRGKALGVLKQVLEDGGADVKEELSSVERRLVGSLMRMHEEAQIDFLEYCISKEKERRQILQRSLGVLRGNKTEINEDAWGWESHVKTPQGLDRNSLLTALKDFHDDAPAVVRETMTGTYDVLMIILDKADGLHQGSFVGCVPPFSISTYKQETLESIDARYCAQKACLRSLKEGKIRQELSLSIQSLLDALHNRSSWMDSMSENSRGSELINDDSSLTMSQWLIRSELIQLEQSLRRQRGQGTLSLLGADVSPLIQELAFVCGAPCPESLRYAASRCLGELDLMAISKVEATKGSDAYDWVTEALEMEDLLTGIQAQAIKVLAEYLYSANASVAIAALDTLIALLPTHAGKECWKILDENTQRALLPIASKKRVTRAKALSKPHLAALKKRAGVGTESSSSAVDNAAGWCWNMALWQCRRDGEGEDSFEEWICTLVPALIECCYNQKRDAKGINDFFCKCQMISCIAPGFASAIFPAIVLNLLESSTDPDASSANAFGVAEDTWIGSFESRENSLLSQSFEFLLGQGSSSAKSEAQDPRPIQLALDTLDLLRRATQSRFLKSDSHKRNSNSDGKSKRNRSRSPRESAGSNGDAASEYNKDLGATEPWKGLPFGTVLRVDGNLIVQALLRVQRYASALFYSDVYLDSFFRGSGAIFEKLSSDFMGASLAARSGSLTDISGYSVDLSPRDYSEVEERALQSLKMLRQCFLKLHEDDAHQAVQRQASDLKSHSGSSVDLFGDLESSRALFPSLADLQRLDAISNYGKRPVASSMCDTMEFLGLQNLLQSYINGIERHQMTHMSDYERRSLRDKWFESRLYGMKWDKSLLDFPEADFEARSNHLAEVVMGQAELSQEEMGFHESITKALTAYARDDFQSCQGLLSAARRSLLNQVKANLLGESSLQGLNFLVERLQSLNDIDSLASKLETPGDTLKRWGFIVNEKSGTDSMGVPGIAMNRQKGPRVSVGFSSFVREIVLRILRFKSVERPAVDQFDPEKCLISHLWDVCSSNRKLSNQSVAEGALYRLRSVLRANTERESSEDSTSLNVALRERLEEASLMESKEDFGFAIRLSKQTITSLKEEKKQGRRGTDASIDALLVDSLIQCGSWLSKYKIEPARTILDSYHKPGARMAKSLYQENNSPENSQRYLKAQIALARLASSLYDTVLARIRSPEWQKSGRSLSERETELMNCKTLVEDAGQRKAELKRKKASQKEQEKAQQEWSELAHYFATLRNEILLVKKERSKTEASVKDHLRLAVDSYASALALSGVGEGMDMSRHVFRMIDLWLHTCSNVKDKVDLNSIMAQAIKRIPSYRFVPLTSQLFAQIDSKSDSAFQQVLHNLVKRMCIDHPYHCLVQLISVCNGREVGSGVSGRCASAYLENMSDTKVEAALEIAGDLQQDAPDFIGKLLTKYQDLMSAYISLANFPTNELVDMQTTKGLSFSILSTKAARLDRCLSGGSDCLPCVLTSPPPVRSGCDYGDGKEDPIGGERVAGFDSNFSITDSGLHRPKIVFCRGTKGGRFRQLVKGEDEIRQDATMEQIFNFVNSLMSRRESEQGGNSARSGQKRLRMVTYNIIPLSPSTGVLEWVENSMAFGDYIHDSRATSGKKSSLKLGAHCKYYPGEWGNGRCRVHYQNSPEGVKRETFDTICKSYSPVFRYFFVERFGHALQDWYAAKMKYTRSCAVSSIVGHILGIGDRHTNNILVSQLTGEVIHIDFGIVFEQGKLLNVPELVPFRLTRNVVDGMGPLGTEGTFTRSAEATSFVLRENANALLTILSAIASDPLYRWSISPVEARRRQQLDEDAEKGRAKVKRKKSDNGNQVSSSATNETKSDRNEAAELALSKISEKLQGYEDGTSGEQQSIEGQVQLLINSARDPDNLCVMFSGWCPWV